jgi:hypothetical protein
MRLTLTSFLFMTLQTVHSLEVAIIGGGAAGLAATRVFARNGFHPTVLEKDSAVGGVWRHTPGDSTRPMYKGLRTNLPREIMAYREFSWGNGPGKSYVTHKQVLEYLKRYSNHFDLERYISYDSKVTQLTVLTNGDDDDWPRIRLDWRSRNEKLSKIFDAVCICNGHYAQPSSPSIPGMDTFTGRVLHSVEYDDPTEFEGQTVLCIGARASGSDLAREISQHAQHVYLSDSTAEKQATLGKLTLVPRTMAMKDDNRVEFGNNCPVSPQVDTVIFCSGYDYSFPFINEKSNLPLVTGQRRVMPLYKQLWHAKRPSVSFLGLPHSVVPFPMFELQAEAVLSKLLSHELPPRSVRLKEAEEDAVRGGPNETGRVEDTHYLGAAQWDYERDLAKMAGIYDEKMENYIATNKAIYDHASGERRSLFPGGPDTYRSTCYVRDDENQSFQVTSTEMALQESEETKCVP